jgi:transposase InsO family protein
MSGSFARLIVTAVVVQQRSKAEVAREFGVSRQWVHTLVRRFETEGADGLQARSRRPRSSPRQIPGEIEELVVVLRKALADQGLDAGPHTIAHHLRESCGQAPSPTTIWRILSRRGFVTPHPHKRPRSSFVRFEAHMPNERWQADVTHWTLGDGSEVEILNVIDDHARFLLASRAFTITRAADVVRTFAETGAAHGYPSELLTDNGAIFTGAPRGGRSVLEVQLDALGVRAVRSRTYHPQTCGKVERFHQTLKRWLSRQRPAPTVTELQAQLDRFADYYNDVRPHRALARRSPREAYLARPKAGPGSPLPVEPHHRVRTDRVDTHGVVTLRYAGRLRHIGLGRRHAGTRVLLLVSDRHVTVITEEGEILRELELDPSRDYQGRARA